MPAHQRCDLFYPLVKDLLGPAINWVMLRSSGPGQGLGSSVANQVLAIRLVEWLGWVFETQEQKKENKCCFWRWAAEDFTNIWTLDLKKFYHYSGPSLAPMRPNELWTHPDVGAARAH